MVWFAFAPFCLTHQLKLAWLLTAGFAKVQNVRLLSVSAIAPDALGSRIYDGFFVKVSVSEVALLTFRSVCKLPDL